MKQTKKEITKKLAHVRKKIRSELSSYPSLKLPKNDCRMCYPYRSSLSKVRQKAHRIVLMDTVMGQQELPGGGVLKEMSFPQEAWWPILVRENPAWEGT